VADSQCGFKLLTASAVEALFGALQTEGFAFDVELLLRAQASGRILRARRRVRGR
jgi:dolichyl-phosphate beta-glucosyltransferase